MSKLSETLAKALAKKQGNTNVDPADPATNDLKIKKQMKNSGPAGKKPPTRSAGRGR